MGFFEELLELHKHTPRLYNINIKSENSDYCTHSDGNKNCYLLFAANFNEDCYYGGILLNSRDCMDCNLCQYCELCYECTDIDHCYSCSFSQELKDCSDCSFCYDCIGCQNCFASAGLRQKQYYFQNQPLSKETYLQKIKEFFQQKDWREKGLRLFEDAKRKIPHRAVRMIQSENCIGDVIIKSKDCYSCFDVYECQDCLYGYDVYRTKDSVDLVFSDGTELCYECFSLGLGTYNCNFCNYIRGCADCEYCELCFSCKNCFGCIGLQNKQYSILNKPYSKMEYEKKVQEIKGKLKAEGTYGKFHLPSTYHYEDTAAFRG